MADKLLTDVEKAEVAAVSLEHAAVREALAAVNEVRSPSGWFMRHRTALELAAGLLVVLVSMTAAFWHPWR